MLRKTPSRSVQASISLMAGCAMASMISTAWADRQAVLGTVNGDGTFSTGRSAGDTSDGVIKEAEMRIQADPAAEHGLDAKTYHLRADCYGDIMIPLGKFASGALSINWTADGGGSSIGGQLTVVAHTGEQAVSGPYILSQSGAGLDRVKLRAVKVGGGAADQYFLYLQYDDAASTAPNRISVAITTTASIEEEYSESSGATASVVPVFSSIGSDSKRFDFYQEVFINSSKALTEATAPAAISSQLAAGGYLTRSYGSNTWLESGALLALGDNSQANGSNAIALGGGTANGTSSLAIGQSQATGYASVSTGAGIASGDFSSATGLGNASGYGAVSLNAGIAAGDYSTAMGGGYAAAYGSTAMGGGSALATGATAMGSGQAAGNFSLAVGEGTIAQAYASVAVGSYNASQGTSDSWIETDDLLVIGNGAEFYPRSNALATLKNGRTTLTNKFWDSNAPTTVPSNAEEASNGQALVVEGHAELKGNTTLDGDITLKGKVTLEQPQGDISMGIYDGN